MGKERFFTRFIFGGGRRFLGDFAPARGFKSGEKGELMEGGKKGGEAGKSGV